MYRLAFVVALSAAILALTPTVKAQDDGPVTWFDDADKAVEAAKAGGKLLLVDLYTDWCGYCKKLDKETFPAPEVQALLKRLVPLKINPEQNPFGKELMAKSGARGFPANVLFDVEWKPIALVSGFKPPAAWVEAVEKALKSWADYTALKDQVLGGKASYDDIYRFFEAAGALLGKKEDQIAAGQKALAVEEGKHNADVAYAMAKAYGTGSEEFLKYKELCLKLDPENAAGHFDEFVLGEAMELANKAKSEEEAKVQLPLAIKLLEERLASEKPAVHKEKGQILCWVLFQMHYNRGRGDLEKALAALDKGVAFNPESDLAKTMKDVLGKLRKE